jgi:hypothetical protein
MFVCIYTQEDDKFSDNRILEQYRKKRLDELKIAKFFNRFGEVYEISKSGVYI